MTIDNELIDNLLKDYKKPEDIIGENGLLKQLTKQLLERAMAAELTDHVGLDIRLNIAEYLYRELGSETFRPPELLRRMVQEGKLGKKTGAGFLKTGCLSKRTSFFLFNSKPYIR